MDDGEGNHVEPAITLLATNHRDDGDGDGGDDGDGCDKGGDKHRITASNPNMME